MFDPESLRLFGDAVLCLAGMALCFGLIGGVAWLFSRIEGR